MTWTSGPAPIVVGVDGSPSSDLAVDWATAEASRRNLPLHLLNAWNVDFSAELIGPLLPEFERESSDITRAAADRVRTVDPNLRVTRRSECAGAAAALVISSLRADTVVVGGRGHSSLGRLLAGSTSMQVAAHAHCPTVVVRESGAAGTARPHVVVGIDSSPASLDAVAYAVTQAAGRSGDLTVVHAWEVGLVEGALALNAPMEVWQRFGAEREAMTAEAVAGWAEKYPEVHIRTKVVHGRPVDALVEAAAEAELLVVGSRGHGGFLGLLLGSVSRSVLQAAPCPVAVVRPVLDRSTG